MAEQAPSTCFIVNPNSANGRTGNVWLKTARRLRELLPAFSVKLTERPLHATTLTREALKEGHQLIISVGGDGTNNEVINGFFDEEGAQISKEAMFCFYPSGTGGDLRRTLAPPADSAMLAKTILEGHTRYIDLGKASYVNHEGQPESRHFLNITSFGLSGAVNNYVSRSSKRFGGTATFFVSSVRAVLNYQRPQIELSLDDGERIEIVKINTIAIANARYFGGGMMMAPDAQMDDGLFDVVTMGDLNRAQMLLHGTKVYSGKHLSLPGVSATRAKKVSAKVLTPPEQPVLLDLDGESPGRLPASFEILPKILAFRTLED